MGRDVVIGRCARTVLKKKRRSTPGHGQVDWYQCYIASTILNFSGSSVRSTVDNLVLSTKTKGGNMPAMWSDRYFVKRVGDGAIVSSPEIIKENKDAFIARQKSKPTRMSRKQARNESLRKKGL